MKNKINTAFLTLVMLFATLYPSGQAYANGLPPKVMTYFEKEDLADKLASDNRFLLLNINSLFTYLIYQNTQGNVGITERRDNREKLREILKQDFHILGEKSLEDYSNIIGIGDLQKLKDLLISNESHINYLKSNFPEFFKLNELEKRQILVLAFSNQKYKENLKIKIHNIVTNNAVCIRTSVIIAATVAASVLSYESIADLIYSVSTCMYIAIDALFFSGGLLAPEEPVIFSTCVASAFTIFLEPITEDAIKKGIIAGIVSLTQCWVW
ncbi:hypothetical protein [Flavobacterium sp.]|uniref:hypothetical protein n=1 Tax=Flavobacterium sp. TaxID=239 RepID=UPI0037521DB0